MDERGDHERVDVGIFEILRLLDQLGDQLDRLLGGHAPRDLGASELALVALRKAGLDLVQHCGLKVAGEA